MLILTSYKEDNAMKTGFLAATIALVVVVVSSGDALAARKSATVQGVLGTSTAGKSLLKTAEDDGYYFEPDSEAGKKILSTCKIDKVCIVRGIINGKYILNAYYVEVGK
jgi:hypothetical protein